MTTPYVISIIGGYFGLLFLVSIFTSRTSDAATFFIANRKAPWPLVAYGMVGVGISGITFISVPGQVGQNQFSYFQLVIGYVIGLAIVALVLLPVFYKIKAVSIYSFLKERYGNYSHKTGAILFLIAQLVTAAFKMYLMAHVLQLVLFDQLGLPFEITVLFTLLLIWLYTFRGGIKTVIITDVLQTTFLIAAVLISLWAISDRMDLSLSEMYMEMDVSGLSKTFYWSWDSPHNFIKLILTGTLLTVMNNGLDQSIMQKHLTCATLRDSQKNIFTLAVVLLVVNILFLFLGGALHLFSVAENIGIPERTDSLYPLLAVEHLGLLAGTVFIIGLAAAAYSSADSSLTGLTTSFCVDVMDFEITAKNSNRQRNLIHLAFTLMIYFIILLFDKVNNESVLYAFLRASGFIYGPLVGLFAFGIFSKRTVPDRWVVLLAVMAPLSAYIIDTYSPVWFGYKFGYDILLVNGAIALGGLFLLSYLKKNKS
ncbi:MAG: sodium:solute symporter [Cyclobacteriaceae bacterium]|nr:sodium:solute symporter [Cyclobacteriaceae bacterium]